jgi:hypothetical protein
MAKFLRKTVDNLAFHSSKETADAAKEFTEFFRKVSKREGWIRRMMRQG